VENAIAFTTDPCTALSRRHDVLILCARVDFTP